MRRRSVLLTATVLLLALGAGVAIEVTRDESARRRPIPWTWAVTTRGAGPQGTAAPPPQQLRPVGKGESQIAAGTIAAPRQIVVRFAPEVTRTQRAVIRRRSELALVHRLPLQGSELLRLPPGRSVARVKQELEDLDEVLYAEPNFIYSASQTLPNDPRFTALWGLHNTGQTVAGQGGTTDADIDAPEAWEAITPARGSVVAVVDTGVAYDHPDLAATTWSNPGEFPDGEDDDANGFIDDTTGWDFVDDDAAPRDDNGHGTHVAGTIAAERANATGIAGVGENVVMPLRVLDAAGVGTSADIAAAFSYAGEHGAEVVNGSFGGPGFSQAVLDAIARYPRTLFVVAAGNAASNNDITPTYPCNYAAANLLCVAATTNNDSLASFSNYGATSVDLAAPGAAIVSSVPAFATLLQDDFGTDLDQRWTSPEGGWGLAVDDLGYYLSDSPGTNYRPNADLAITASPIDAGGQSDCVLSYVMRLDTEEDADVFLIEASHDGSKWTHVAGWTGSTAGNWIALSTKLPAPESTSLYLRFRLTSNNQIERDGVDLDDVMIRCVTSIYSGNEYRYFSGTSMASPHVAGAAGALIGAAPEKPMTAIKQALLAGVDPISSLVGRTLTAGRLNLNGAAEVLGLAELAPAQAPSTPAPAADESETAPPEAPPETSPAASPAASPTPTTSPEQEAGRGQTTTHPRAVRLRLRGHLVARGRVVVADGFAPCRRGIRVVIRRNGSKIATAATDPDGTFRIRLSDRPGRYLARVRATTVDGDRCEAARSPLRRHAH